MAAFDLVDRRPVVWSVTAGSAAPSRPTGLLLIVTDDRQELGGVGGLGRTDDRAVQAGHRLVGELDLGADETGYFQALEVLTAREAPAMQPT